MGDPAPGEDMLRINKDVDVAVFNSAGGRIEALENVNMLEAARGGAGI